MLAWFGHRKPEKIAKHAPDSTTSTSNAPAGKSATTRAESVAQSSSPVPSAAGVKNKLNTKQPRDLWKEAFLSLSPEQRGTLQSTDQDGTDNGAPTAIPIVNSVIDLTKREYKDYCTRGWHTKKGDKTKETNVRIRAKETLCSALQFKDIIDSGLQFDPSGYGKIVWGVISGALRLLQNNMDRVDAIFDSAAEMAKILPKYAIVEAQYRDRPLQEQGALEERIVNVYSALLQYTAEAQKGLNQSIAGRLLASVWSIENQAIIVLRDNIAKKDAEATDMLQLASHQQRRMEFTQLDEKATQALDQIDGVVERLLDMKKLEILKWLSDAKPSDRQHTLHTLIEQKSPNSGKWFLDSQEFLDWQENPSTFLWLNGVSGCGKSSLCSTIIQHLMNSLTHNQGNILAYWYFDNGNPKTQDLRTLLRSILRQIAAFAEPFPSPIRDLAAQHEFPDSSPSVTTLSKVLQETISVMKENVYIVIDAIDEYPADGNKDLRQELIHVISDLVEAQLEKLHLLVTSIDEDDIRNSLHPLKSPPADMDIEPLLLEDLNSYLDAVIERYAKSKPWWTDGVKAKIEKTLKADGYKRFRITVLQLDDLGKCLDEEEIDAALNSIPRTIEDLYERKLRTVGQKDVSRLRHIFYWISLAERQLSLKEIAAAPGVKLRDPNDVFTICPKGMIAKERKPANRDEDKDQDSGSGSDQAEDSDQDADEIITFDHPSVKRFLSSQNLKELNQKPATEFFIADQAVHPELTKLTLEYLLALQQPQISATILETEPFLSYAAQYWAAHLQKTRAATKDESEITPKLLELFASPMRSSFINWMRVANPVNTGNNFDLPESECPSPLYVAIELKLQTVTDHLIDKGDFIDSKGGKCGTALQLSIAQGNDMVALQLIQRGADVDHTETGNYSPLYSAVLRGASEIVRELLAKGAKTDKQEGEYGNVLQLASFLGFSEVVKELLASKANVNADGGLFGTPLQAASAAGHDKIVAILLDNKARPDVQSGLLGNAVQAAVTGGYPHITEKLIANGADFDAQGDMVWQDAFNESQAEEGRADAWSLTFIRQGYRSEWKGLETSQQMLAAALQILRKAPQDSEKAISRLSKWEGADKTFGKYKSGLHKLIISGHRLRENGWEGMNRAGFLYKALFWASVCQLLPENLPSGKAKLPDELSAALVELSHIVEPRKADQSAVEHDDTDAYAAARFELTQLYKRAFMLLNNLVIYASKNRSMRILKAIISPVQIDPFIRSLREQDQKFLSTMFNAKASAVSVQTSNLESRILERVHREIQRSRDDLDQRFQFALHELEQRVLKTVRDALPAMIQEVQKVVQEQTPQGKPQEDQ